LLIILIENQYGISGALESVEPVTAKFPFAVPEPPGQPRVIDWDANSATLTWEKPYSKSLCGFYDILHLILLQLGAGVSLDGAKIQGYKIEMRDVAEDTDWRAVNNDYLVKDTTAPVHNLVEGHEYEFRIR